MIERIYKIDETVASQVIELGKQFYSLTGLKGEFHGNTFVDFWNELSKRGQCSTWIFRCGDTITGALGVIINMSLFDGKTIVEEMFWFVHPDHRGTAGIKLFLAAQQWAKESGAARMMMGKMLTIENSVGDFYEKNGFRKLQTQYIKDL